MRMRLVLIVLAALVVAAILMWRQAAGDRDGSVARSASTSSRAAAPLAPSANASPAREPSADASPQTNQDGTIEVVVKSRRRAIADARVSLYVSVPGDGDGVTRWRSVGSSITGANGKAKFVAGPGRYFVSARAGGFATGRREIARREGDQVTVAEIELGEGLRLSGRTVDRRGKGTIPAVEIILTQQFAARSWCGGLDEPGEEDEYALSDARGHFRLEGLAPARYCVRARAPGYARPSPDSVALPFPDELLVELTPAGVIEGFVVGPDGKAAAGATVQLVGDRRTSAVETGEGGGFSAEVVEGIYHLQAQRGLEAGAFAKPLSVAAGATVSGVIIALGAGASIGGTIVSDAEGTPIAGASIAVSPHRRSGDSGRAVSTAVGEYVLQGLAPGAYDVVADAIGYAQYVRSGLVVEAGQYFSLDLKLFRKGTIEGRVADSAGRGIAGALVSAETAWGRELEDKQAISGDNGHYRLSNVGPGKTFLRARRNATSPGVARALNVLQGGVTQLDFTLTETGVLTGKVSRPGGKVPAETRVSAYRAGGFDSHQEWVDVDASGQYRVELSPGDYRVYASAPSLFGVAQPEVTIEPGTTVTQDLTLPETEAPRLSGVVLEPEGIPAARAQVVVSSNARPARLFFYTDEEGRFQSAPLFSGEDDSYTVIGRKGGRLGQLSNVVPGSTDVAVQLAPAASIEGRVLSASGAWRGGFALKIGSASIVDMTLFGEPRYEFAGDAFVVEDVRSGTLKLEAQTADGEIGTAEVSTASGQKVYVEIPLSLSASIAGRLVEAETGRPIWNARLFTRPALRSAEVNADGSFAIRDLPGGSHTLSTTAPGRAPFQRTVTVAAAENLDLGTLELPAQTR